MAGRNEDIVQKAWNDAVSARQVCIEKLRKLCDDQPEAAAMDRDRQGLLGGAGHLNMGGQRESLEEPNGK